MSYNTAIRMKTVKRFGRRILNALLPTESLAASKKKWNELAKKNAAYYVMTDYGEEITEEQFRASGEKHYRELIENDSFLQSALLPLNTKDVLEIGCGIGRITECIAKNFQSVSGVDISEEMIEKARARLARFTNATFTATNGTIFPFSDNSFDFVFSFIVFQHMPDKETIAKNLWEIGRVLQSDGVAKIQVRGLPTSKRNWFYGPALSKKEITEIIAPLGLKLLKTDGENQRYFWIWLQKNAH